MEPVGTDPSNPMRSRRLNKLSRPGFQLRLTGTFLGLALLGQLLQFLLASTFLQFAARDVAGGGVVLAFGILMTHRIAGPAYRLTSFLRGVAEGVQSEPCNLRKGDEFKDLCEQVNRTTAPLRARALMSTDARSTAERPADECLAA